MMNFDEFWAALQAGGTTEQGDRYQIVEGEKLHILSPGNHNKYYRIKKETVRRYFEVEIPNMTEANFRKNHSSYFMNVYNHIINL